MSEKRVAPQLCSAAIKGYPLELHVMVWGSGAMISLILWALIIVCIIAIAVEYLDIFRRS